MVRSANQINRTVWGEPSSSIFYFIFLHYRRPPLLEKHPALQSHPHAPAGTPPTSCWKTPSPLPFHASRTPTHPPPASLLEKPPLLTIPRRYDPTLPAKPPSHPLPTPALEEEMRIHSNGQVRWLMEMIDDEVFVRETTNWSTEEGTTIGEVN